MEQKKIIKKNKQKIPKKKGNTQKNKNINKNKNVIIINNTKTTRNKKEPPKAVKTRESTVENSSLGPLPHTHYSYIAENPVNQQFLQDILVANKQSNSLFNEYKTKSLARSDAILRKLSDPLFQQQHPNKERLEGLEETALLNKETLNSFQPRTNHFPNYNTNNDDYIEPQQTPFYQPKNINEEKDDDDDYSSNDNLSLVTSNFDNFTVSQPKSVFKTIKNSFQNMGNRSTNKIDPRSNYTHYESEDETVKTTKTKKPTNKSIYDSEEEILDNQRTKKPPTEAQLKHYAKMRKAKQDKQRQRNEW